MLPLHAALAFNAPFDVVLRLYHLYPGAVRNRDDQGMLALHHCFKYGAEDRVLELLLNVFPEALTVRDDKGRLPLACTPRNGSDNERRSHILTLFADFQVELARKEMGKGEGGEGVASVGPPPVAPSNSGTTSSRAGAGKVGTMDAPADAEDPPEEAGSQPSVRTTSPKSTSPAGTLGAAPRYDAPGLGYGQVAYGAARPMPPAKRAEAAPRREEAPQTPPTPSYPRDDGADKYAAVPDEDGENVPSMANAPPGHRLLGRGLSPIPEDEGDEADPSLARRALKSELLSLGSGRRRKGLGKLFGKRKVQI
ncbi:hypothetical protein ACHAWF_008616 [Thalassiosira exigua]